MDQSYLGYDCKLGSFNFNLNEISAWKSLGIFNRYSSNMKAVGDVSGDLPDLKTMVECVFN